MTISPDTFEPVAPDDTDLAFSIPCPTCGAHFDQVCETDDGYADDDVAHSARIRCAIAVCDWDDDPFPFAVVKFDAPWSGGCSPVVDEQNRDAIADYACEGDEMAQERAEIMALTPDADGLYHLLPLGWAFVTWREARV